MDNEYGIKVALSPVQMAAVLSDKSISAGETLSNRLFGGLGLAGGVVEMFGAGAMCIVPEPTMLTKAGCVFVGTHGLDTIQASIRQIWTGRQTSTDTYNSAVALAESLGADQKTAMNVGMTVDLAIPMGFAMAIGAVRVTAIRSGRIKIAEHESLTGRKPGGHTLEKHIGKTPEQLRARFEKEPRLYESGCFRSLQEAEQLISKVVRDNKSQIEMWVRNIPPGLPARMTLHRTFHQSTGILVKRGSQEVFKCHGVGVVLDFQPWNGKPYFILTAFPEI
ncbi:RNase A-like domain-containing protein [Pantoea sp. App145]|uniref:RNase A-like domain-containing protein n=1 Tax=Pantoea sp. App145 TaxID=3071567 RepID=UPI003A7F71DB